MEIYLLYMTKWCAEERFITSITVVDESFSWDIFAETLSAKYIEINIENRTKKEKGKLLSSKW